MNGNGPDSDIGTCLTEEECYYLYTKILSSTFIPRDQYILLRQVVIKIRDGIRDYRPPPEK